MIQRLFVSNLYTGQAVLHNQVVTIENHQILSIDDGDVDDRMEMISNLAPGFIDCQVNGGSYAHFTKDPTVDTIQDIYNASVQSGTAYVLPTLITSSLDNILAGIGAIKTYQAEQGKLGVLGMHLEGPYISKQKRGAHLLQFIQDPTEEALDKIIAQGRDVIRLMTVAPEKFKDEQLKRLIGAGIKLSAGHSNATYEEALDGFAGGIETVTHFYNAMSSFVHRAPGLVGATLDSNTVYAPIILDGEHCDYAAARIAYTVKKNMLFLISDALFLGKEVTHFQWGEFDAALMDDRYINSDGNLAGATISMGDAVRNAVQYVHIPLQEAIEMATIRPAKVLGLENQIGKIAPGYPAIFTTFNADLTTFQVLKK
jgi:N-acetylglucosamine-6-phosphate deacetylase